MKRALVSALVLSSALAACDRKKPDGLPPATDWQAPAAAPGGPAPSGPAMGAAGGHTADPHAGVPGAPPLGGGAMGADPHAGVPGAPPLSGAENPHGAGGVDVTAMGLPAPDPDRPIDPTKVLEGTIDLPPALRAKVPAGAAIFISVRPLDPASGEGRGAPVAVDKLVATGTWPLAWKLTEAQAMIGGTGFAGDVVVSVRFDQDSDAMSKQPGDITGTLKATIPQKGLQVVLDKPL